MKTQGYPDWCIFKPYHWLVKLINIWLRLVCYQAFVVHRKFWQHIYPILQKLGNTTNLPNFIAEFLALPNFGKVDFDSFLNTPSSPKHTDRNREKKERENGIIVAHERYTYHHIIIYRAEVNRKTNELKFVSLFPQIFFLWRIYHKNIFHWSLAASIHMSCSDAGISIFYCWVSFWEMGWSSPVSTREAKGAVAVCVSFHSTIMKLENRVMQCYAEYHVHLIWLNILTIWS